MKSFRQYLTESDWKAPLQLYQRSDGSWRKIIPLDNHGELPPGWVAATDEEIEAWKNRKK